MWPFWLLLLVASSSSRLGSSEASASTNFSAAYGWSHPGYGRHYLVCATSIVSFVHNLARNERLVDVGPSLRPTSDKLLCAQSVQHRRYCVCPIRCPISLPTSAIDALPSLHKIASSSYSKGPPGICNSLSIPSQNTDVFRTRTPNEERRHRERERIQVEPSK
jgi:hypothetical protein